MGNQFGCEVCESRSNARYDIEFKSNSTAIIQKPNPRSVDKQVIPQKLRLIERFHIIVNQQKSEPEIFDECRNEYGRYVGELVLESRSGQGIQYYEQNNEKYFGQWKNNLPEGFGVCVQADDSVYVGSWKEGQPNGPGVITMEDNSSLTGHWDKGKLNGNGIYISDHYMYHGQMTDSLRNGLGICTWSDGSSYRGFWKDDNLHGFGVLQYSTQNRYEGNFVMNMKDGIGIQYYNDQSIMSGLFTGDQANGYGTITSSDGLIKSGIWLMGQLNGLVLCNDQANHQIHAFQYDNGRLVKQYNKIYVDNIQPEEWEDPHIYVENMKRVESNVIDSQRFAKEEEKYLKQIKDATSYLIQQQQYVVQ